jgi:hypothetical protein
MEEYQEIFNLLKIKQKEINDLRYICDSINKEEDELYSKIMSYHEDIKSLKVEYDNIIQIYKKLN